MIINSFHNNVLSDLAARVPACTLKPRTFFVAWHGVLTLAYEGFPQPILSLKENLAARVQGLKAEFPGSRWPHTTLGCLKEGRELSLAQLTELHRLCRHYESIVRSSNPSFSIKALQIVLFQCRSLERRLLTVNLPLDSSRLDDALPPADHRAEVERILSHFAQDNLPNYLKRVQRPGFRANHYQRDYLETTLVYDWTDPFPPTRRFIEDVDALLPDYYHWFHPSARHVTIRTLASED